MISDNRKICCLTPTGDRKDALNRSRFYFERSLLSQPVDWIVVDDGIDAYNPGGCIYLRREPDGPKSLDRQFIYAVNHLIDMEYTDIIIWEDDDWYSPTRIQKQCDALLLTDLHGWTKAIYYNVKNRVWYQHMNNRHASFYESAMKIEIAQFLVRQIEIKRLYSFIDMELWEIQCNKQLAEPDTHCIGIKGMPGRMGLGMGHTQGSNYISDYISDKDLTMLKKLIGEEDTNWYERFYEI